MVLIEARSSKDSVWSEGKRQEDAGSQSWGEEELPDFTKEGVQEPKQGFMV
jgi:hypothetical protein